MTNTPPSREFYRPRIGQAATGGLLITCQCFVCRRYRAYIATDLLQLYRPDTFLEDLFGGRCPRCGSGHNWRVRQKYPSDDDVGRLTVRRLAGIKQTPMCRDELYSAKPKPPPSE